MHINAPSRFLPVALWLLLLAACSSKEAPPEPVRAVRTLTVGAAGATATHEFAAEVRARTESRLGFRVGGKLESRAVNNGDSVRAGQVLARLDPSDLRLAQEAAQAGLRAAQTNLEQLEADYKRYKDLREQGFVGPAELERRDAAVKAARAQFDQARAQAAATGNQTAYGALVADASGVITAVEAEPGQVLAAGTPVLRLAHDGPRDAVFSVPEDQIAAVRALRGKAGALSLQAWGSEERVPLTVREVAGAADPVTRTFLIKADAGSAALRLGQTATVRLPVVAASGQGFRLPLTAVVEGQGASRVWLFDRQAGTVRQQAIVVGGADGNTVLVASGLKVGDEVVIAGTHVLTPGQKVRAWVDPAAVPAPAPAASR